MNVLHSNLHFPRNVGVPGHPLVMGAAWTRRPILKQEQSLTVQHRVDLCQSTLNALGDWLRQVSWWSVPSWRKHDKPSEANRSSNAQYHQADYSIVRTKPE
jgi:hypothetical protein